MLHTPGHLCVPGSASAAKPRAGPRPAGQGALPHSALASRWLWAESLGQADLTQFKGLWDKAVPRPPPPAPGTESGGGGGRREGTLRVQGHTFSPQEEAPSRAQEQSILVAAAWPEPRHLLFLEVKAAFSAREKAVLLQWDLLR